MKMHAWIRQVWLACLLLAAGNAVAADQCPVLAQRQSDPQVAIRIAAIACDEHLRWNRPFIDTDGRLASLTVYEAENTGLRDGGSPWRRVAFYWQASGLLASMGLKPGASDCGYAAQNPSYPGLGCRGFVIDTPWSAAFISWVMQRAGVPGFQGSASHFDYVRATRRDPAGSPYRFVEPMSAQLETGDMLCSVRGSRVYGHDGLARAVDGNATGLPMHCDMVVSVDDGKAYAIGGNVQQAVTLRILHVNAKGQLWGVPLRTDGDTECSPETQGACNFNRQDWAVVLKLKSQEDLAKIGPVTPPGFLPSAPVAPTCCVNCVLGSGVPRCPEAGQAVPRAQPDARLQGSE